MCSYQLYAIKRNVRARNTKETQLKFYKILTVPAVLYSCDCSTVNRQQHKQTEAVEMRRLV
jgi:hypothetical protein